MTKAAKKQKKGVKVGCVVWLGVDKDEGVYHIKYIVEKTQPPNKKSQKKISKKILKIQNY